MHPANNSENESQNSASCPGAPPQKLEINDNAYVCTQNDSVLVRSGPGTNFHELTRLSPGTRIKIINGPECANNWSWWKVRVTSGSSEDTVGWMAEGGDHIDPYFICP
jgi:uncharacterized protein YgiM (DUF1202 family)